MKLGFSFSPGGLLLPYHLGVLDSLTYHQYLDTSTPLAGASAGAIAVAAQASELSPRRVLDWTVDVCAHCHGHGNGRVRGRLLPLLKQQLHRHIGDAQFDTFQQRTGTVGIAYKEVYPEQRNVLQTEFDSRQDLVTAVCHSSMFPFFTSDFPCLLDYTSNGRGGTTLRLVVDGVFAEPDWERLGCPDLQLLTTSTTAGSDDNNDDATKVDREVRVSVLPQAFLPLGKNRKGDSNSNYKDHNDIISPTWKGAYQLGRLARLAVQGSSREELTWLYEAGIQDAERWCRNEQDRERIDTIQQLRYQRVWSARDR